MPYISHPAPPISTVDDLRSWVEDELGYIEQGQFDTKVVQIQPSNRAADKPRDGMVLYADGTNFNPGLGAGCYEYRAGAWHKLAEDLSAAVAANTAAIAGPTAVNGFTNGSNAAAGKIGEYLSSIVTVAAGVSIATGVATQIRSLVLTPGDWDLWGEVALGPPVGGVAELYYAAASLWTTSAASPTTSQYPADGVAYSELAFNATGDGATMSLNPMRINITTNTTYFLNAYIEYGATSLHVGGAIRARRRR